jgi:hypothetical protein
VINENGRAVAIRIVDVNEMDIFDQWNVRQVIGHFLDRKASASAKHIIFIIRFSHKTIPGIECTTLCEVGAFNTVSKTKLIEQQLVRDYVKTYQPKPAAFGHLEKRWNTPAVPHPPISLNTKCLDDRWADIFSKTRPDVDSLEIKSFRLTEKSIANQLITFVPRQVDVGTVWSSVKPPPRCSLLCGPRPTIMVYLGIFQSASAHDIRVLYADRLRTRTNRYFHPAVKEGSSMFSTSKGSIDVTILMEEWLGVVETLGHENRKNNPVEQSELEKMKLAHIIYHGWKSDPGQIL